MINKKHWENRPIYDKAGAFGEHLVKEFLQTKGWSVCAHDWQDGSHFNDFTLTKFDEDNREFIIQFAEVKTKPSLKYYPNYTGFDKNNYYYYNILNKTHQVTVFFIDSYHRAIFAASINRLNEIEELIPSVKQKVYNVNKMTKVRDLTADEVITLINLEEQAKEHDKQQAEDVITQLFNNN